MVDKKVFIVSAIPIFPVIAGNQKDMLGHILLFKELGYDITLFCYNKQQYVTDFEFNRKKARKYGINIEFLKRKTEHINKYTYWYQVRSLINAESIRKIQSYINKENPDLIFFEYMRFAYLCSLLKTGGSKIIFRVHNFELLHDYDKEKIRMGEEVSNWLKLVKKVWRKWISIFLNERLMLKLSDQILCISWGDFKFYKKIFKANNVVYVPPYLGEFKEVVVKDKEVLDVFYMGSNLINNVNRSGADYLIENIIPAVNKELPGKFRFHITGKFAKELYGNKGIQNLIVHGFIEDIESFYDKMDIACIPVKAGRGCKLKMFEALAKGVPTVGFRRTFYGIPYEENSFLCAENEIEYVKTFERLRSLSFRQKLSQNSKKKIDTLSNRERLLFCLKDLRM